VQCIFQTLGVLRLREAAPGQAGGRHLAILDTKNLGAARTDGAKLMVFIPHCLGARIAAYSPEYNALIFPQFDSSAGTQGSSHWQAAVLLMTPALTLPGSVLNSQSAT
jgi:hypothetical protein